MEPHAQPKAMTRLLMHCRGTIYFYFLDMTLEATRISNQPSPMPSRLCVLAVEERACLSYRFLNTRLLARVWARPASHRSLRSVALNPHGRHLTFAELDSAAPKGRVELLADEKAVTH